ncbi:hypothetical protein PPYR_03770 [Photinus pyralis]|uniref:Uncharacterized protein n=1 Tax=Photinus pyralis TaxID=7054 RepID=A0A1Y1L1X1_PHOPY|nr:uncharacterized protein LOC116164736 isoform X1 [Photinus pyralis]XP_031334813.1 uncharacterized protein LOC116164736 isoform X2 [Photinus pyralis]KAB0801584.1 hypothetical protein PPYR_03770 [Photinus pyralis]
MGCGHSKINIYPKKYKNRNSPKKSVTINNSEPVEQETAEESELNEKLDDCDSRKTIKVKPFGGPLLAQVEISLSQQNFFKMLDEKIENGPDYDAACEAERAAEAARLRSLLRNWETASAGSRSLPTTPIRKTKVRGNQEKPTDGPIRSNEPIRLNERIHSQIPPNVIHQSYGVTQPAYRQTVYNPVYQQTTSNSYSPAMQYQVLSPMYINQQSYQQPSPKLYPSYNQHGSPIKMVYQTNNVKHIPVEQSQISYSPSHKVYGSVPKSSSSFTNGDLIVQQQIYNQQIQYQQSREYQQYRQSKEQMLLQQQGYQSSRSYHSSVHIPIVMHNQQNDVSPLHRKQYEMT